MARGRKSTRIKVITYRDKELLKQLSKTGICNTKQAKEHCNLNISRLQKLEKSGYIKMHEHIVRGEANRIIALAKEGKEFCRQELGTQSYCIAQTNHLAHDLKLTEIYYRLNDEVKETWKHESELIKEYYKDNPEEKGQLKTFVDATVEVNGELIAIESLGDSYTNKIIEMKQEIAASIGCSRMECV